VLLNAWSLARRPALDSDHQVNGGIVEAIGIGIGDRALTTGAQEPTQLPHEFLVNTQSHRLMKDGGLKGGWTRDGPPRRYGRDLDSDAALADCPVASVLLAPLATEALDVVWDEHEGRACDPFRFASRICSLVSSMICPFWSSFCREGLNRAPQGYITVFGAAVEAVCLTGQRRRGGQDV
jgi:hypothetical protein